MNIRDKTYVLNPYYHLRNDIHRIILFSKAYANHMASKNWHSFIHPLQASVLSFFTYNRRFEENLRLLSVFLRKEIDEIEQLLIPYIENPTPIYIKWQNQHIYFPKNILVDLEKVKDNFQFKKLEINTFSCKNLDLISRRIYTGPLSLTIMLTNKCVVHCKYCYADTSTRVKKYISTPRILELIKEAAGLKVQQINLIGGEIFLHKDWDIILKELVDCNVEPSYISTKISLTQRHISKLKESGFKNTIQISLDTLKPSILEETLKAHKSYSSKVLRGIQLLDYNNMNYQISSVLTKYNCDTGLLYNLFHFLSTLKHLNSWKIIPISSSINNKWDNIKASKKQIEFIFEYLETYIIPMSKFTIVLNKEIIKKRFYKETGGSISFNGAICSALNTHIFILPDGKVTICEQLYWNDKFIIGDINSDSIKEIWDSPQALSLIKISRNNIQEKSRCKNCKRFEECFTYNNRCWSNIINAYGENCWDFPDPRCYYAPKTNNNISYK